MKSDYDVLRVKSSPGEAKPTHKTLIRTANRCVYDGACEPPIVSLIPGLWNLGEIAIFAGDAGTGKTLFAVTEINKIAQSRKVLYYDFELSDRQFEQRYSRHTFSDQFYRAVYDPKAIDFSFTFADIEEDIERTGAGIIVVDNVSALSLKNTADPDAAIGIMRGLKQLQVKNRISTLVLAHVPKIADNTPLTLNHLAGSKHFSNFADSVFFIGKSQQGKNVRYIKQVKNRSSESRECFTIEIYDNSGCLTYRILDELTNEGEHIRETKTDPESEIKLFAADLFARNIPVKEIQHQILFTFKKSVDKAKLIRWNNQLF